MQVVQVNRHQMPERSQVIINAAAINIDAIAFLV
jgi:hypothetical protein